MEILDQIPELLYSHNCVIIPGFGGFVANFKAARFQEDRLLCSPAIKKVAFNQSLTENDGLLVQHLAKLREKSYAEAEEEVAVFVRFLFDRLKNYRNFEFRNIGSLYLNSDENIVFVPYEGLNFYPKSYGLEEVKVKRLKRIIDHQRILEQHLREPEIAEAGGDTRPLFPWKAAVAAAILVAAFGLLFWQISRYNGHESLADQDTPKTGQQQTASFFGDSQLNQTPLPAADTGSDEVQAGETATVALPVDEVASRIGEGDSIVTENIGESTREMNTSTPAPREVESGNTSMNKRPAVVESETLEVIVHTETGKSLQTLLSKKNLLFGESKGYHIVVVRTSDPAVVERTFSTYRKRSFQPYVLEGKSGGEKLVCIEKFYHEDHARKYLQLIRAHENPNAELLELISER